MKTFSIYTREAIQTYQRQTRWLLLLVGSGTPIAYTLVMYNLSYLDDQFVSFTDWKLWLPTFGVILVLLLVIWFCLRLRGKLTIDQSTITYTDRQGTREMWTAQDVSSIRFFGTRKKRNGTGLDVTYYGSDGSIFYDGIGPIMITLMPHSLTGTYHTFFTTSFIQGLRMYNAIGTLGWKRTGIDVVKRLKEFFIIIGLGLLMLVIIIGGGMYFGADRR